MIFPKIIFSKMLCVVNLKKGGIILGLAFGQSRDLLRNCNKLKNCAAHLGIHTIQIHTIHTINLMFEWPEST